MPPGSAKADSWRHRSAGQTPAGRHGFLILRKTRFEKFAEKRKAKNNDRKGLLLLCIVAGFYIAGDALTQLEFFGLVDLTDEQLRK